MAIPTKFRRKPSSKIPSWKKKFIGNSSQILTTVRQVPTDTIPTDIPTTCFIGSVSSVIGRNIFPTEAVVGKMSDKILTMMLLRYLDDTWIRRNFREPGSVGVRRKTPTGYFVGNIRRIMFVGNIRRIMFIGNFRQNTFVRIFRRYMPSEFRTEQVLSEYLFFTISNNLIYLF